MKISVIVPIYNSEKYLHFCLDSIINQTYKDFELILVDDGSCDKSLEICHNYAEKDNRIKVFHKENAGQSTAKNLGIENATGDYFYFLDSDDIIHPQAFEILSNTAEKTKSDTIIFHANMIESYDYIPKKIINPIIETYNTENLLCNELIKFKKEKMFRGFVTKFIKKSFFEKKNFCEKLRNEEDILLSLQLCFPFRDITYIKDTLFFCKVNPNSVTRNKNNFYRNLYHLFLSRKYMIEELERENYKYTSKIISNFILILIKDLRKCSTEDDNFIKLKNEICEFFDKYNFDNIYSKTVYKYFKKNNYKKAFALSGNSFFTLFKKYRKSGF